MACSTGCNAAAYNIANPNNTISTCHCHEQMVCNLYFGRESNGVNPGTCFLPPELIAIFAANAALFIAAVWFFCCSRRGRRGKRLTPPHKAPARMSDRVVAIAQSFYGSPLFFNAGQFAMVMYTLYYYAAKRIEGGGAIYTVEILSLNGGRVQCLGNPTQYANARTGELVVLGVALADTSLTTFVMGVAAVLPAFRQYPRRQAVLGILILALSLVQFCVTSFVERQLSVRQIEDWNLEGCAAKPPFTGRAIMNSEGVKTVNRIILLTAVLQTLMAGFCARQLAFTAHWCRIQWYPHKALKNAQDAAKYANARLASLDAFVVDDAVAQDVRPTGDRPACTDDNDDNGYGAVVLPNSACAEE